MSFIREVEHLQIPLPHILSATNNFDESNFIAVGGFGKVYQGQSEQYGAIAVKRLYRGSGQGQHEFMMEISLLSAYKHENLVSLLGFCDQDDEKILRLWHHSALLQEVSTSKGHIIQPRMKREENGGRNKLVVDDESPEEEKMQKSRKRRENDEMMTLDMLVMDDLEEGIWLDEKMMTDVQEISHEFDHEILHLLVYETVVELCRSAWEKPITLSRFFAHEAVKVGQPSAKGKGNTELNEG
ncbi:hypothetical protein L6452_13151 [Arctium lappa]|uniref:Uncharacterized protein n=1 Tax=Arctium lappa TaxID=4217 RepID=A0ACB9CHP6_ARCLA|nr:hypothetical protein L6452_13151 [Arctium lappa]